MQIMNHTVRNTTLQPDGRKLPAPELDRFVQTDNAGWKIDHESRSREGQFIGMFAGMRALNVRSDFFSCKVDRMNSFVSITLMPRSSGRVLGPHEAVANWVMGGGLPSRRPRDKDDAIKFNDAFEEVVRKLPKCNRIRPKCSQCLHSLGFDDCEYDDNGYTNYQRLQAEKVSLLESQIEVLENPRINRSEIALHDPYPAPFAPQSKPMGTSNSGSDSEGFFYATLQPLISSFLRHGSQFGFFLNVKNFWESAMQNEHRPAAVLLDVVYLWAIHLSGSSEFIAYEPRYPSRALRRTAEFISGNNLLPRIQAEVLLSQYFRRNRRFLEGKYHMSVAVSLIISAGLHQIRSPNAVFHTLPGPPDAVEEQERINAFWTVLTLNNCWTVEDGLPSIISYTDSDVIRIDTLWPLDINGPLSDLPDPSSGTVTAFLANERDDGMSVAALHAKAAILFEQASLRASRYRLDKAVQAEFSVTFQSLDALIDTFKFDLPPVHVHPAAREILTIHALAHVATIQLHKPFVMERFESRVKALDSARAIVAHFAQMPLEKFEHLDPIIGVSSARGHGHQKPDPATTDFADDYLPNIRGRGAASEVPVVD
ncbi:hypothetical protein K438DRAFT_1773461 [Mycena galopus ATCC 62051]|nr:hypothetical protein K438DRAFT_1773461 [Mycena galopus ATCC 62051]